jgi:hypothetical protein
MGREKKVEEAPVEETVELPEGVEEHPRNRRKRLEAEAAPAVEAEEEVEE